MSVILTCAVVALGGCSRPRPERDAGPRIVSLAPNLTEIVCAVNAGDRLVGRTTACNYPPAVVTNVPAVGGFGAPSLELLLKARPTIILEVDLADKSLADRLRELGIPMERVPCRNLDDIPAAIRRIGEIAGAPRAGPMADKLAAKIAELRQARRSPAAQPAVFVEIWDDPLTTAGKGSFLSELVALAGGRNVGDRVDKDFYVAAPEWVVAQNPDIILGFSGQPRSTALARMQDRPGWAGVNAVRTGRVYAGLNDDVLLRPGPRVLDGIEELRRCIEPAAKQAPAARAQP